MQAEMRPRQAIAQRVTNLREGKGWTKGQLATYAKVSPSYVTRLEAGKIPSPSGTMLTKIARALRVSVETLLQGPGKIRQPTVEELAQQLQARCGLVGQGGRAAARIADVVGARHAAHDAEVWPNLWHRSY